MDNKLSELSKPVFEIEVSGGHWLNCTLGKLIPDAGADFSDWQDGVNRLYSQEYVSALEQKIAELEQAMRHIHGAVLDLTVPRVAIAKAAQLAVEHASMKEQSNG